MELDPGLRLGVRYRRRVQISPRYDGPAVLTMDGSVPDPGLAVTRQRRRMERMLAELSPGEWASPSRCAAWSVRDVVAHLVTVNRFWEASVRAGRDGSPTRLLTSFDPAVHPAQLVESLGSISGAEAREQFVASNDGFLEIVAELTDDEWSLPAESPVGHVGLDRVIDHALWDSWVHERDIGLPLRLPLEEEADELAASLRYVAAVGPALSAGRPGAFAGTLAVAATDPDLQFVVAAGTTVTVHSGPGEAAIPCLRGAAADLIDALSVRTPLPPGSPDEWRLMMEGLATAFDTA